MTTFLLRPEESEMIRQCYLLHCASQPFPWSESTFSDMVTAPYSMFYVKGHNEDIVGYAIILTVLSEVTLMDIAVHIHERGKGMGMTLLNAIFEYCEHNQCEKLLLEVRQSNDSARILYDKMGMKNIAIRKHYYPVLDKNLPKEDAIIMEIKFD